MAPLIDPWPGTPGGAYSPAWGENIRLFVQAAIWRGSTFRWAPAPAPDQGADTWSAGNVWGSGSVPGPPAPAVLTNRLWVSLTCDVLDLETHLGGTRSDGALARSEAATARIVLADPTRKYDPLNPDSPFAYQGRSRLMPGTPVMVWAETVDSPTDTTVTHHRLFTGTVDTWAEPWTPRPAARRATVVASDEVKTLVGLDRGEQPPAGAGDTVAQRIERVLQFYGWTGTRTLAASTVTEAPTTFASSAWDLIGKASDDEVGFVHLDPYGVLRFHSRATWATAPVPVLVVGCSPTVTGEADIVIDATVITADAQLRNAIYAGRQGGVVQAARSQDSIDQFGENGFKKTDLGLADDGQAATWATFLLSLQGWPRARLETVTLQPTIDPTVWPELLSLDLVADRVRVLWTPPDATTTYDVVGRVIGVDHHVSRHRWTTDLQLIHADVFARRFRWGPAETDQWSAGNVWAATPA